MIKQSKNNDRSVLITDNANPDAIYKEFIEAPMNAARQPAMATGLDLLAFMTALPDAFIASEERELKRLTRTSETKDDARIERLRISIERAQDIRSNTDQGKARIKRALVSLSEQGNVFHGFVSDTNLNPRKGLTVRISVRANDKAEAWRSTTTDSDGYFSITLDDGKTYQSKKAAAENNVNLSGQMEELLSRVNAKTETATDRKDAAAQSSYSDTGNQDQVLARVEILDDKNVIYQDSSSLVVNEGSAYREYVVDGSEPINSKEPNKPAPTKPTGPVAGTSNDAAKKPVTAASAAINKAAPQSRKTEDAKTKK